MEIIIARFDKGHISISYVFKLRITMFNKIEYLARRLTLARRNDVSCLMIADGAVKYIA